MNDRAGNPAKSTGIVASTYDAGPEVDNDRALCLHRNENLFVGSDWTVRTAQKMVARSAIASYPQPTSRLLREALGELYGVSADCVFVGNGSDEVLADLLALLRSKHETVHLLDICFKVYPMLAERMGFRQATLPGKTFETGRVDSEGFLGLAVVDSPNGITGSSLGREELLRLAENPESFLIWDNVYGEYAGDTLPASLPRNVAFVRSFSKYYALAGLRVGYCIADPEIVGALLARKDAFNVNGFAQVMALEALRRRDEFDARLREMLACRTELVARLRGLGFNVHPAGGIAVLATHPRHSGKFLQAELLRRDIAVRRFEDVATRNFIRVTVPPMAGVERLCEALGKIVDAS